MSDAATSGAGAEALSNELKLLKGHIMAEIEAKLSQKEDILWRRGQVEIQRLKQDQQQVLSSINTMQEREAALIAENQKIRGTLQKFEHVVQEMREVLGTLIHYQQGQGTPLRTLAVEFSPSPSVASTAATEANVVHQEGSGESMHATAMAGEKQAAWSADESNHTAQTTPAKTAGTTPIVKGLEEEKTFCTPPRSSSSSYAVEDVSALTSTLPVPPSWRAAVVSSPAVLSLATVLSSSGPQTPNPPSSALKVNLAECLEKSSPEAMTPAPRRRAEIASASPALAQKQEMVSLELVKEEGFQTLGIEVNQVEGSLVVDKIDEHGLVGYWNNRRDSNQSRILTGDRIIEVNGIKQDSKRMLHECKVRQRLSIVLARTRVVSTESPLEVGSPVPRKLRPEAQVFVPCGQKDVTVSSAPPGLEYEVPSMVGGASCPSRMAELLATTPQLMVGDQCDLLRPMAEPFIMSPDQQEVKRALFP